MIRWGVIGCGEATEKKSGPAFQQIEGSKIEAVMSRSADRARSYAERHGISKWYTNVMDIIDDPNVNAIYIATPPSSHATYAIMALKAGKPVYIEKPMAASYEDCIRINRASEETGVPCFVAYYRRYLPYFKKVEELIPRVGKVQIAVRHAVYAAYQSRVGAGPSRSGDERVLPAVSIDEYSFAPLEPCPVDHGLFAGLRVHWADWVLISVERLRIELDGDDAVGR